MKPNKRALIAAAIEKCRDKDGRLHPERVIEAARNPKSPLHDEFEWDLHKAAHEHWIERARQLIREVKLVVVVNDRRLVCPMYVSDPMASESSYIKTQDTAENGALAERVMLAELDRIESAINRARSVSAVLGLDEQLERMLQGVITLRQSLRMAA